MTETNPKSGKRRSISKARLLREVNAVIAEYKLESDHTIADLVDAMKEEIVRDALEG